MDIDGESREGEIRSAGTAALGRVTRSREVNDVRSPA